MQEVNGSDRDRRKISQSLFGANQNKRLESTSDGGTEARDLEVDQASPAQTETRILTSHLMEEICEAANLNQAYKRVKSNRGSAGIDGMSVDELLDWLKQNREQLLASLQSGNYRPHPVKAVAIPKTGGGVRELGIPTVVDRFVQQAILQILQPVLEPKFSDSSYGFRPGRSAHQALQKAQSHVAEGHRVVVDLDLEKFFDRVNHDMLMARLARHVGDKRLLRIVRRFLQAGILKDGVCVERVEGTPQGGPLSPLLANLLLTDLDRELEKRGHRFCRYADDCNIYVRTPVAGQRVMTSVVRFLEQKLKLRVNREKSAVAEVDERKFLGYRLRNDGTLQVAPESIRRLKTRIQELTRRTRGVSLEHVVADLNSTLPGWVTYFRLATYRSEFAVLDSWLRCKIRCYVIKQKKRRWTLFRYLRGFGLPPERAWSAAANIGRWWRIAHHPAVQEALDLAWFDKLRLVNLTNKYLSLRHC